MRQEWVSMKDRERGFGIVVKIADGRRLGRKGSDLKTDEEIQEEVLSIGKSLGGCE
jgi:hypothetical protein